MEKCEICGRPVEDFLLETNGHGNVCHDCATELALRAKAAEQKITVKFSGHFESCGLCQWCNELFPESELHREADLGLLCGHCVMALQSRGESMSIIT